MKISVIPKTSLTIITFLIFLGLAITPITSSIPLVDQSDKEQELDLLHGEVLFYITAADDIAKPFNITWAVPLNYADQAPIYINIKENTTANITNYKIVNDTNQPNKVIIFSIAPMNKDENASINFEYLVLVKNNDYSNLPRYVKMPRKNKLPEDTKIWLTSTKAIQSDNLLIKLKAKQLKGLSSNLIKYANRVVLSTNTFTSKRLMTEFHFNKLMPFLIRISNRSSDWVTTHDALSALFLGGSCTARANLGAALFRANNIPAKNILITATPGKKYWMDCHYMCEYYCPGYGWIPAETTFGSTPPKDSIFGRIISYAANYRGFQDYSPYEPKNYIIIRVNYPEDENLAGNRLDYYGGCEPWFWTDDENANIWWIAPEESGQHGWIEKELITSQITANNAFNLTRDVYELHITYFGVNLTGLNITYFYNAILAQQNAVQCFNQSDIFGYYENMTFAYNVYQKIEH